MGYWGLSEVTPFLGAPPFFALSGPSLLMVSRAGERKLVGKEEAFSLYS
jgi:hypothetical protein